MEVLELIRRGIVNDELSFMVFLILTTIFLVDLLLYIAVWINLIYLNWQINRGSLYRQPIRNIINGFEDLLELSSHQINTRAYVEDFFSRYKFTFIPFPLNIFKLPTISTLKFIKNTVSLFILVGVLGTFIGIYSSLVQVLNPETAAGGITRVLTDLDSITPLLSGMGTAFATSIVGMSFALLTTFLLKLFNAEQFLYGIMARLINYLDNEVKVSKKSFLARSFLQLDNSIKNQLKKVNDTINNMVMKMSGFAELSSTFKEASAHMNTFNQELAASMEDMQQINEKNKKYTEIYSKDVNILTEKIEHLYSSINEFVNHQQEIKKQVKTARKIYDKQQKLHDNYQDLNNGWQQREDAINSITDDIAGNMQTFNQGLIAIETSLKREEEYLQKLIDISSQNSQLASGLAVKEKRLDRIEEIMGNTADSQRELNNRYRQLKDDVNKVATNIDKTTAEFVTTVNNIKSGFNNQLGGSVNKFIEHVDLSDELINQGFHSLQDKVADMDRALGKYLHGLAFNTGNLEEIIGQLNDHIKRLDISLNKHNDYISDLRSVLVNELKNKENKEELEKDAGSK